MHFETSKKDLFLGLSRASNLISLKVVEPVFSNVILRTDTNQLEITAGNREQTLRTWIPASIRESGEVALPGRRLFDIVRLLPDLNVEMSKIDHQMNIACGKGRFILPTDDPETFPTPPVPESPHELKLVRDKLMEIINLLAFIIPRDDARRKISGALFELKPDGLTTVATDGYRLAKYTITEGYQFDGEVQFVVTVSTLQQLQRLLEEEQTVRIEFDSKRAVFYLGKSTLFTLLLETRFPQYQRIIPQESPLELTVDRLQLIEALKRVSVVANQLTHEVRLKIENNVLTLWVRTADLGEANEEMDISFTGNEPFEIAFNSLYLHEILEHINTEKVHFKMENADRAVLLYPAGSTNYFYLLMPLRLE